jgi:hypothetical protein
MIPVLLHEAGQVGGFLVYDCSHNQLKTQTIDLTAPKDCKDPTTDYYPARTTKIRIILTDGDMPDMATQCLVLKTQEVVRCGGHPSFHYGSVKIAINQPVEVTPQECRDALIAGKISIQGQKMDFKIGASHYHQYYSEGGRAVNGDCVITTFTRKGVTYEKSYEEITIKSLITIRDLKSDNTIRFPSGLIASHADGVVRDVHDGMLVWSTEVQRCQDCMLLMYQGRAKLHQARSNSNVENDLEEAIILVEQNETRRYAGLVLEGTRSLCGHVCHNTQIPDVVVCMDTEDPNKDWKFQKSIDHEAVNLLTHMHFFHLSRGLGNFRRFEEFQEAVCQVERKGLFNQLQALASGNKYALHDIYGPGFQIYLAGSVAYIAQCLPVEARIYDPVNCTQQIPAEIGSEEHGNVTRKYANAQTMILQDFPPRVILYQGISAEVEDRRQMVLQLPNRPGMQRGADSAQPHLQPHLPQHEGHLQRHQRGIPAQFPNPREPAVETAGTMPGGRCACVGVHGPVQLPESRDFGQTPGSDYHEEGCLCLCHDDHSVLRALRLDVVLPERDHGALHYNELHLQRDPEDNQIMEGKRIRVVAARRPLGSQVQSPPPSYDSGEEHHGLQQGASRASSPNVDKVVSAWHDRQRSPSAARRNRVQS